MEHSELVQYHSTVRQTIAGLDNVRLTLILQSLVLAGAIAFIFRGDTRPPQEVRITVEAGLTLISFGIFLLAYMYAVLLQKAVAVAKALERTLVPDDEPSRLTHEMDEFFLAGGRWGLIFYSTMALIAPVASLVVLVLDSAGKL